MSACRNWSYNIEFFKRKRIVVLHQIDTLLCTEKVVYIFWMGSDEDFLN